MAEEKEAQADVASPEFNGDRTAYPDENLAVLDEILGKVKDSGQLVVFLDGYEGGLVGYCTNDAGRLICIYDYDRSMDFMARQYMESDREMFPDYDEAYTGAVEWYEFNTVRSLPYVKDGETSIAPTFIQYGEEGQYMFILEGDDEDVDAEGEPGVLPQDSRFTDIHIKLGQACAEN